jgi:hypothetical protein
MKHIFIRKRDHDVKNEERLTKLRQAETLIREVEFSYPVGDPVRLMIYRVIVENFSLTKIGNLISQLKASINSYHSLHVDEELAEDIKPSGDLTDSTEKNSSIQ